MSIRNFRPVARRRAYLGGKNRIALITSLIASAIFWWEAAYAPIHLQPGYFVGACYASAWCTFLLSQFTYGPGPTWLALLASASLSFTALALDQKVGWPYGRLQIHHHFGNLGQSVFGTPLCLAFLYFALITPIVQLARRLDSFYFFLATAVVATPILALFANALAAAHLTSFPTVKTALPGLAKIPLNFAVGSLLVTMLIAGLLAQVLPNPRWRNRERSSNFGWLLILFTLFSILAPCLVAISHQLSVGAALTFAAPSFIFLAIYYLITRLLTPEF